MPVAGAMLKRKLVAFNGWPLSVMLNCIVPLLPPSIKMSRKAMEKAA